MSDVHADIMITTTLKSKDFMVMTIGGKEKPLGYSQYIPRDKIPLIEIICEDGVFLVLLSSEDYQTLDLK